MCFVQHWSQGALTGKQFLLQHKLSQMTSPEIAREWHPTKNDVEPDKVTPVSNKKVWWLCERRHEWRVSPSNRVLKETACPSCSNQSSKNEIRILTELHGLFGEAKSRQKIDGLEVDVFLPMLSVAIEFDGSYWHQDKEEKDRSKQAAIEAKGIKMFRVREAPLRRLSQTDIVIPKASFLTKEQLNKLVSLIGVKTNKTEGYLAKSDFTND